MKLKREFYKLPLCFDSERLAEEVSNFSEDEWREHPQKFPGNTSMVLISARGELNDEMSGPMAITEKLRRCPYIQQVLASFKTVFGRSRLMRLAPGAEVSQHNDVHYYWRNRVRIHIPIITDPSVRFFCADTSVHMAAGESWIFDNWKPHRVINPSAIHRIHLVADTVGTAAFWNMVRELHLLGSKQIEPRLVSFQPQAKPALLLENYNQARVLPPAELGGALRELILDLRQNRAIDPYQCGEFVQLLDDFRYDWQSTWVQYGPDETGWPHYRNLLTLARKRMAGLPRTLVLSSTDYPIQDAVEAIFNACLDKPASQAKPTASARSKRQSAGPRYDRPVFIVAAPRSGSTLLFEMLASNRAFTTLGDESHKHFESIPALRPANRRFDSNRLLAEDASPATVQSLNAAFNTDLRTADGKRIAELPPQAQPGIVRFLEKTPKNALRIPFLLAMFPDARFIYLRRGARDNISSLLDSWRSERYVTYPDLPDWDGPRWSHLLIPGWRDLQGATLAEIVSRQWQVTNQIILADLQTLPAERWCAVSYEDLLADPAGEMQRLCAFAEVPFGPRMHEISTKSLRPSRYTLTAPQRDKWLKNAAELEIALPLVQSFAEQLDGLHTTTPT